MQPRVISYAPYVPFAVHRLSLLNTCAQICHLDALWSAQIRVAAIERSIGENLPFIQMADLHARLNKLEPGEPDKSGESVCQKAEKMKCKNETKISGD
jgi:hypothetical protein